MSDTPSGTVDNVERFGSDLRRLRIEAGTPTYDRLRSETGISKSVLTDAFSGRLLPSARTVDAIVRVCGGDTDSWLNRRESLANSSVTKVAATVASTPQPAWRKRNVALVAVGAFVIGAVASGVAASLITSQITSQTAGEAHAQITVKTGENPGLTACVDDAKVATADTRADNSLIEILWSNKCQAGWGRVTRYDGLQAGNTVTIAIYPQTAPDGPDRQEATEHDVQGAYTNLVVRPSPDTLLCAEGSFSVDGKRIDLGDPICT